MLDVGDVAEDSIVVARLDLIDEAFGDFAVVPVGNVLFAIEQPHGFADAAQVARMPGPGICGKWRFSGRGSLLFC